MFYPYLCGAFHHQEEDDDDIWYSPVSTPRKARARRRRKDSKNPYSTRGLDQFSALLAELEEKRRQIYSQMGSQGIVRFVYKNSNDCVPVVIKLKNNKKLDNKTKPGNSKVDQEPDDQRYVSEVLLIDKLPTPSESDEKIDNKKKKKEKRRFSWDLENLRRPSYCIPAAVILILLLLVFFGRSASILCTCVGWYIVPTISGEGSSLRTSMKKKDYVRKLSGNNLGSGKLLSSPMSQKFGVTRDKSPPQHHRSS